MKHVVKQRPRENASGASRGSSAIAVAPALPGGHFLAVARVCLLVWRKRATNVTAESRKAFDIGARALRWVAFAIIAALVLAVACWFTAGWLRLAALFAVPHAGAFGATEADLRVTPEQYAGFEAEARSLHAWSTTVNYLGLVFAVSSAVAAAWCALKTWTAVKHWHWLSFLGLACLLALVAAGDRVATSQPAMLGLLALDAVALTCAAIDLTRRQYGTPGRVVAWATGLLSIAMGVLLWSEALGPNGVIGRWLDAKERGDVGEGVASAALNFARDDLTARAFRYCRWSALQASPLRR